MPANSSGGVLLIIEHITTCYNNEHKFTFQLKCLAVCWFYKTQQVVEDNHCLVESCGCRL